MAWLGRHVKSKGNPRLWLGEELGERGCRFLGMSAADRSGSVTFGSVSPSRGERVAISGSSSSLNDPRIDCEPTTMTESVSSRDPA